MNTEDNYFLSPIIHYFRGIDVPIPVRQLHYIHVIANSFGRVFLRHCRLTWARVLNGRIIGDKKGKYTFFKTYWCMF